MHSIRFKITAITIAEILMTILLVFMASFFIIQSENDRRSVEMMDLIVQDTQKSLEKYSEDIEKSVETISNLASDSLDGIFLAQNGVDGADTAPSNRTQEQQSQIDAYMAQYTKKLQSEFATVASHTRGVVTYYYCINPSISIEEHGFFYSKVGRTGFDEREPLDARKLDPGDIAHTTWYYTPIQRGRPSWVGPYTAHFLGEMLICSYLVPIYKSGNLIGVLGMDIPLDTLVMLVSSIHVYDTGFASLLDEQGHVLYHPKLASGTMPELPIDNLLLEQRDSSGELIRYTVNGEERQMSFTTLPTGMKLVIVAPTSEVDESSIQLMRVIPPIAAGIIAVIAFLTLLVMHFITRPLLRLTTASQELAAANYDVQLDYNGKDEVGALTRSFKQMRDQLGSYIDDLNRQVLTDHMTGLPNQRHFFRLATEERDRLVNEGGHPALLYFNLLGMKHFNRQYGFDEGDRLICEVASILSRQYGKFKTSRFGQDHFVVIADERDIEPTLARVFDDIAHANNCNSLPVSVGIYQNDMEVVDVSVACDRAKYACDRRRGTYISGYKCFDKEMLKQVDLIRHVINHLDQALEEQWIKVYYQPIVRAVNGHVCDEEALSRWIDPERGFLSPAAFIPALENAGLIYKLDLYVLEQTLQKMKQQRDAGFDIVAHSINLSRSDFDACDIVEEIRSRVDDSGFNYDRITIEITESIIGSDFEFMKEQIERFQSLGFPVWIDDFGSGYSSLDFLQSFKFDLIKFDMSFLRKLDEGDKGKIILTELMQMATSLGVDTICEGVETEDHVRFLREIGCSKLQGYYFCRPIPLDEIFDRYQKGIQIGYESPREAGYYEAVGRVNLYDLTSIAHDDDEALRDVFDVLPMGIMEINDDVVGFVRTNPACREFMRRHFGLDFSDTTFGSIVADKETALFFLEHAKDCCDTKESVVFDANMSDGALAHFLFRRVSTNPVTHTFAVAVAVLSVN